MHPIGQRKLLHYGIHPEVVASHVARMTSDAAGQRLTKSMRINKPLRRAFRIAYTLAAGVAFLYLTGANL